MNQELDQAIVRTIVWFDLFDFPLTIHELHRWLYQGPTMVSIADIIERCAKSPYVIRRVGHTHGLYHVRGKSSIVTTRAERTNRARAILHRMRFRCLVWLIRFVPGIQFVGLVNSYGYFNVKPTSDIDFFIIIRDKMLYTTRFFITMLAQILGVRRHGTNIAHRICLSFYTTEQGADLAALFLPNGDPCLQFCGVTMLPLFDGGGTARFEQQNVWIHTMFRHMFTSSYIPQVSMTDSRLSRVLRSLVERVFMYTCVGVFIEDRFRAMQHWKMKHYPVIRDRKSNASVVISDTVLKFHENDRREELRRAFYARCRRFRCLKQVLTKQQPSSKMMGT